MRPNTMKRRAAPVIAALALAVTVLTATPALATYSVSEIAFPNSATTFFSPFSGPADITFNFNDYLDPGTNDPRRSFNLRLRVQGSSTSIHTENVSITPSSQTSPRTVHFSWPAESVTTSTTYEVAVYNGGTLMRRRTFTLKPHLVRITSINPSPFFPRVVNGYRDTTNVTYRLEASSNPVVIDIFRAATGGVCCGTHVRHTVLSNVVLGTRHFIWNGTDDSDVKVAVGRYYVRITATAFTGSNAVLQQRAGEGRPLPTRAEIRLAERERVRSEGRDRTAESGRELLRRAGQRTPGRPDLVSRRGGQSLLALEPAEQRQEQEGVVRPDRRAWVHVPIDEGHHRVGFLASIGWARSVPVSRGQGEAQLHLPETLVTAAPPRAA